MIIQISLYLTIGFISYLYYKKWKLCQVPKNFRYRSDLLIKEEAHGDGRRTSNPTRDRFKEYKVPDNLDAIVIGSGIGGLSCAGYLARAGWKVLVLEQHYLAGGCTHVFKDKGYEFETGIHYIGNIKKRQELLDLITEKSIKWQQLGYENNDPDQMVYDEIIIGDRRYKLRAGEENWLKDMIEWFPEEEKAIRLYLKIVKKVAKKDSIYLSKVIQSKWLQQFYRWSTSGSSVLLSDNEFQDWAQVIRPLCSCCPKYEWCGKTEVESTVEEVLDYLFEDNLEIKAVLAGQFGDYGEVPEKACFLMHASVVNHYLEGGFYPVGGSDEFAKQIIPVIERTGGRVLVGQRVDRILLKDGECDKPHIYGVEMSDGTRIYCPTVISTAGLRNTFTRFIPEEISNQYTGWPVLKSLPSSRSFIYLFVGLKGSPITNNLSTANYWIYPHGDYNKLMKEFDEDPLNAPMPLFIASAASKEGPSWLERHEDKCTLVVLTLGHKDWFTKENPKWETQKCTKRDKDYKDFKNRFAKRLLEEGLYKYYPELEGKVEYYEIATPLSMQHYLGNTEGEGYGSISSVPERFQPPVSDYLEPNTGIKGLYLSGQDVCTLGFTGALAGGLITANKILGYGTLFDILTGRDLVKDIKNLDKTINKAVEVNLQKKNE